MRFSFKKTVTALVIAALVVSSFAGCKEDEEPAVTAGTVANNEQNDSSDSGNGNTQAPTGNSNFDNTKTVSVVTREQSSGTRTAFIELFGVEVKDAEGKKTDKTYAEAITADATDIMMTNVSGNINAIGYCSMGSLNSDVRALKISGVDATTENVKNGTYSAQRPFNIVTKGEASGVTRDFIDFILSEEGQKVVADNQYIEINENAPAYSGSKPSGTIKISGSSSVSPVMEKLQEAYLEVNTNAEIEINTTDSGAGIKDAGNGTSDIGMASRELTEEEKTELKDTQIALDGIAVIVNPDNPLADLTKDQVREIFTGEKTKWSDFIK